MKLLQKGKILTYYDVLARLCMMLNKTDERQSAMGGVRLLKRI